MRRKAFRKHLLGFCAAAFVCALTKLEVGMWIMFQGALIMWALMEACEENNEREKSQDDKTPR
jgi:hypothetical protein